MPERPRHTGTPSAVPHPGAGSVGPSVHPGARRTLFLHAPPLGNAEDIGWIEAPMDIHHTAHGKHRRRATRRQMILSGLGVALLVVLSVGAVLWSRGPATSEGQPQASGSTGSTSRDDKVERSAPTTVAPAASTATPAAGPATPVGR